MINKATRRDFLKTTASVYSGLAFAAGAFGGVNLEQKEYGRNAKPLGRVRIGLVGAGSMGMSHLKVLLQVPGCELRAICDIVPERVKNAQDIVEQAGFARPAGYSRGETDFERLCRRDDIDIVYNATPWHWHVPICVEAMKQGKHTAVEVPAALDVKGCWELVDTAEETGLYCMMLENCCYDRIELMLLNMARKGVLGEIVHAETGYRHDCRDMIASNQDRATWRREMFSKLNGNLYPTHGLGPVALYMDVNRGDVFDYLVSMSTPVRGQAVYENKHAQAGVQRKKDIILGDVNTSMIKTKKGYTIVLQHELTLPRPYSRMTLVQGTKGIFAGYPPRIYLDDRTQNHDWDDASKYFEEFDHPLYRSFANNGKSASHGSMDYIVNYRLIEALRNGIPPDMDVYDAAAWSCIVELSQRSLENKSQAVDFPDFTRGQWKTCTAKPLSDLEKGGS